MNWDDFQKRLGVKTLRYYRMVKGFWCPTGSEESIFSEADILSYEANSPAIWREPPVLVAGFDPSFTNGGDRSILYFAKLGYNTEGLKVLEFLDFVELQEDATNKRAINADAKLEAVFGKPQVTMFELAGIVGKHLQA